MTSGKILSANKDTNAGAVNEDDASVFMVVAPMNLPGGYEFDATVSSRMMTVVVPEGGVEEGECLQVPFHSDEDDRDVATVKKIRVLATIRENNSLKFFEGEGLHSIDDATPEGLWRNGIFSCFDVLSTKMFWVAFFFPIILIAQLMQRIKFNFFGYRVVKRNNDTTCISVFSFALLLLATYVGIIAIGNHTIASAVYFYFIILKLYWSFSLRNTIRKDFGLPPLIIKTNTINFCDDLCMVMFCNPCSLIQIARHTHNENLFPYVINSVNGLAKDAPGVYFV